jgi:hypothetical protein
MQSTFPPLNSLEQQRAAFAYLGGNQANVTQGAYQTMGTGHNGTVVTLASGEAVASGGVISGATLLTTLNYQIGPQASGQISYWPDDVLLYLNASAATTITVLGSPDGVNFYNIASWSPAAASSTSIDLGRVAQVNLQSSAAVTLTAQLQVTL